MKKTGEFWLNCLEDDVREKWIRNYDDYSTDRPLEEYLKTEMGFYVFIHNAFVWRRTHEGKLYWEQIYLLDEDKLIKQMRNYKLKQLGL